MTGLRVVGAAFLAGVAFFVGVAFLAEVAGVDAEGLADDGVAEGDAGGVDDVCDVAVVAPPDPSSSLLGLAAGTEITDMSRSGPRGASPSPACAANNPPPTAAKPNNAATSQVVDVFNAMGFVLSA